MKWERKANAYNCQNKKQRLHSALTMSYGGSRYGGCDVVGETWGDVCDGEMDLCCQLLGADFSTGETQYLAHL